MTKHDKAVPLRRQRENVEDAPLIRSAESLGRMIGSLQRQLEGASKRFSSDNALKMLGLDSNGPRGGDGQNSDGHKSDDYKPRASRAAKTTRKPAAGTAAAKSGGKSGATKVQSTADRKSKRASKSATAKKTAARGRSGASRKASKSSRSR
jgi:hypothetical protein